MKPDDMKPFARFKFPGAAGHLVYELRYPTVTRRGWVVRLVDPVPKMASDFYINRRQLARAKLISPAPVPPVMVICNPVIL
jgi:hypothetical protein